MSEKQSVTFKSLQNSARREQRETARLPDVGKLSFFSLKNNLEPVSAAYFNDHLTFFCRMENRFEKMTQVPFRFRLGSVAYTDYLEQKPNASRP